MGQDSKGKREGVGMAGTGRATVRREIRQIGNWVKQSGRARAELMVQLIRRAPREHWLRRLAPFVADVDISGAWHTKPSLVYVLVSPFCKRFYVGKSDRTWGDRWMEHCRAVTGTSQQRVHRFLRHHGIEQYAMVPLAFVPQGEAADVEKVLIRRLQPALNSYHREGCEQRRGKHMLRSGASQRHPRRWMSQRRRDHTGPGEGRAAEAPLPDAQMAVWATPSGFTTNLATVVQGLALRAPVIGKTVVMGTGGTYNCTDFTALRRVWGETLVSVNGGRIDTLSLVLPRLRHQRAPVQLEFWAARRTGTVRDAAKEQLIGFLRHPPSRTTMYTATQAEFVFWLRVSRDVSSIRTRHALRGLLYSTFCRRFGFSLRQRLTVKVAYSPMVSTRGVAAAAERLLDATPLEPEVRGFLRQRMRVVFTARQSVGDIIHNHRAFGKTFAVGMWPEC